MVDRVILARCWVAGKERFDVVVELSVQYRLYAGVKKWWFDVVKK